MTKEQFVTQLIHHLEGIFPQEEYRIRSDIFVKNNSTKRYGLIIQKRTEQVHPTIYVDDFFEDYLHKKITLSEISERIQQIMKGVSEQVERYSKFSIEWPDCQSKVTYRLISMERNKELLSCIPHIPFLNLAIVFSLVYQVSEQGLESICITQELQDKWKVSTKELFQQSEKNTIRLFEPHIETMENVLYNYLGYKPCIEEQIPSIYIFSNKMGINGATVLIYKDLIHNFAKKMQSNLYIIPSSIHECVTRFAA